LSFASLTDIGGGLYINANSFLASWSIPSIGSIGETISVTNNASLCSSLVDAFLDTMLALGWDDTINVHSNRDSC
jgi:hypothetical protein